MAAIVIIDDDETFADLTRRRLEGAGHEVTLHTEATTAIPLIASGRFDVLVLDLNMPGLSGADLLAVMRNLPSLANLRVLLHSSGDVTRLRELAEQYDVAYLTKSASGDELVARVGELVAAEK